MKRCRCCFMLVSLLLSSRLPGWTCTEGRWHQKKLLALQAAQELARDRGGELLSKSYINSLAALHWKCEEGHLWEACFHVVKNRGRWCPHCARRLGLETARLLAEEKGGQVLSESYLNCEAPIRWRCHSGHEWEASLSNVRNHHTWCPHCHKITRHWNREEIEKELAKGQVAELLRVRSPEGLQAYALRRGKAKAVGLAKARTVAMERGGELLSESYEKSSLPLRWRCKEGHEWVASVNQVKDHGNWCPLCAHQSKPRRLQGLEVGRELARERGGELLSESYKNSRTPLRWRCKEGHTWEASLDRVKNHKTWCPHCSVVSRRLPGLQLGRALATERGGELLSETYVSKELPLQWRCKEGHEWSNSLKRVKDQGYWCPHCTGQEPR